MRRAIIAIALTVGLGVLLMLGCGGGSSSMSPTPNVATGSVVALGTDAPLCNVFSVSVTITGITLTPQNGGTPVSILGSGQSLTIDFLRLMEFNTMLNLASVPVGTYSQMTLTLSNAQITVLDLTQTPPQPVSIPAALQNATVAINLDPALSVTSNGTASLLVDFHLFRSLLSLTTQATINPVMTVARISPTSEDGLGRLDDLHGIVQSVSTTSTDSAFTGSFALQTLGGTGPVLTVHTTSDTNFEDVSGLSGLAQGDFVEVDAAVDTSGHIVAKEVELAGTVQGQGKAAFEGIIIGVQRDANGNATQFTLFVREGFPDVSASIPLRSALTVNVGGNTNFLILRPGINEAGLTLFGLDHPGRGAGCGCPRDVHGGLAQRYSHGRRRGPASPGNSRGVPGPAPARGVRPQDGRVQPRSLLADFQRNANSSLHLWGYDLLWCKRPRRFEFHDSGPWQGAAFLRTCKHHDQRHRDAAPEHAHGGESGAPKSDGRLAVSENRQKWGSMRLRSGPSPHPRCGGKRQHC